VIRDMGFGSSSSGLPGPQVQGTGGTHFILISEV
jgi:hypothetical protein